MSRRIIPLRGQPWRRIGVGRSTFWASYVKTGRVRLVRMGRQARGIVDDELEGLIDELIAERDEPVRQPTPQAEASEAS